MTHFLRHDLFLISWKTLSQHDIFLKLRRTLWRHDTFLKYISQLWRTCYPMTHLLCHSDVLLYHDHVFLTLLRIVDVMTYFWLHEVFLTSWHFLLFLHSVLILSMWYNWDWHDCSQPRHKQGLSAFDWEAWLGVIRAIFSQIWHC